MALVITFILFLIVVIAPIYFSWKKPLRLPIVMIIAIILILAAINLKRREDLTKVGTIRALQNLKD